MPRFAAPVVLVAVLAVSLAVITPEADAESRHRATVATSRKRASLTVREGTTRDAVFQGQRRLWLGSRHERVISRVVWSKRRDAVAFATRKEDGALALVVVLIGGDVDRHELRWAIPATMSERLDDPTVTWLGKQRVAFGPSELRPSVVASWRVRR